LRFLCVFIVLIIALDVVEGFEDLAFSFNASVLLEIWKRFRLSYSIP
jgi:hypothetical protein